MDDSSLDELQSEFSEPSTNATGISKPPRKRAKKAESKALMPTEKTKRRKLEESTLRNTNDSTESEPAGKSSVSSASDSDEESNTGAPSEHSNESKTASKLSKAQRKRAKKRDIKASKLAEKAKRSKREEQPPATSSFIVLPKGQSGTSSLDTDEKKLAAVRMRLSDTFSNVLKIQPVPCPCPPGLIKDLCPLAVSIRFPSKSSARYAFLHFRNEAEMETAKTMLSEKSLNGKPLKVTLSSSTYRSHKSDWREPEQREMFDFDWNTLFVTNLPRSTTRLDLGQIFRKASKILMPTYDDGSCKGACFLTYKSGQDALRDFETRHHTFIHGSPIYVNFSFVQKPQPKTVDPKDSLKLESEQPEEATEIPADPMDDSIPQSAECAIGCSLGGPENIAKAQPTREPKLPKLLHKYQLKKKGSQPKSAALSALEALLRPPAPKPKHAKKTGKGLTKRGKPSKHR